MLDSTGEFELKIEVERDLSDENKSRIDGSKKLFKLEKVYSGHKNYVRELIKKIYCYNDQRIDELMKCYEGVFNSKQEIIEMVYGNYFIDEERMIQRPLSKLTQDILLEFGVDFDEKL